MTDTGLTVVEFIHELVEMREAELREVAFGPHVSAPKRITTSLILQGLTPAQPVPSFLRERPAAAHAVNSVPDQDR